MSPKTRVTHDGHVMMFCAQVWREFPDRLVGFPSRSHSWSPTVGYRYESEWFSNFSIVLTGAAFHHKVSGDHKFFGGRRVSCEAFLS